MKISGPMLRLRVCAMTDAGKPAAEIAAECGCAVATVHWHLRQVATQQQLSGSVRPPEREERPRYHPDPSTLWQRLEARKPQPWRESVDYYKSQLPARITRYGE